MLQQWLIEAGQEHHSPISMYVFKSLAGLYFSGWTAASPFGVMRSCYVGVLGQESLWAISFLSQAPQMDSGARWHVNANSQKAPLALSGSMFLLLSWELLRSFEVCFLERTWTFSLNSSEFPFIWKPNFSYRQIGWKNISLSSTRWIVQCWSWYHHLEPQFFSYCRELQKRKPWRWLGVLFLTCLSPLEITFMQLQKL